ncbi:hypothetical protein [Rhizobium mayense]|uniref:Uncharacterized protein n=1 Tax=Rhizobium mayense TaxID=1312184 RepID=A0ABT7JXF6_9HYPH|nr:hypothetical protein [Rhizobium mayense]MDL2400991.1 hypothetical protein [Rhizobium mayense]
MYELGPVSDVVLFFDCMKSHVEQVHPECDWSLLTDRLYRRYIALEDLDPAIVLMERARQIFTFVRAASGVEWDSSLVGNREKSWLNPDQSTLADVFSEYFECFAKASASAKSFEHDFHIYKPVKTIISDLAGFLRDDHKSLDEYDALDGKPFWLR